MMLMLMMMVVLMFDDKDDRLLKIILEWTDYLPDPAAARNERGDENGQGGSQV